MPDDWTEAIVTAEGKTPKFELKDGAATFTLEGQPASLRLDHPTRAAIANLSGGVPGTHDFREVGESDLLDLLSGRIFSDLVATGECEWTSIELRSIAIQFHRTWVGDPRLRKVAFSIFLYGAIGLDWPGITEFAAEAGVCYNTVTKYLERALAVGLPVPPGLDDKWPFKWMAVRRECVFALLREGLFTKWPTLIERVDELAAAIEDPAEREAVLYVGQAVVSLRLREKGEGRVLVKAELEAEGAALEIRNQVLDEIIASVQNGLPEL